MGKTTIVKGNVFLKTGGNFKIHSDENIENHSQKQVIQKGEDKGVTHNKPKTAKLTDLKVTKVEGPFDENGKKVDKIKRGYNYTYKATTSRKPSEAEVKLLKWSTKDDNKDIKEINGVATHNILKNGKIHIGIKINADCEKSRIYAYYKKPSEKVSIEVELLYIFRPYIIAKSKHRKGLNEEGTGTHHDMMSSDMTDQQIITLNPDTKKWIDLVNKEGMKGVQSLSNEMLDLLTDFSMGELEEVNVKMHRKFIKNISGDFSDAVLTKNAEKHQSTKLFLERLRENMKMQLRIENDFVYEKKLLKNRLIINPKKNTQREDIPSPSYSDNFGGLGIAVNDTWGYDTKITSFRQDFNKRTFSAEFETEIFDHYGLNSDDIDPKIKGGFTGPASFEGFLCWFILQHKCGYKPFFTIIKFKHSLSNETY